MGYVDEQRDQAPLLHEAYRRLRVVAHQTGQRCFQHGLRNIQYLYDEKKLGQTR